MKAEDYDDFRARYQSMTPAQIMEFHEAMFEDQPEQNYYSPNATKEFFHSSIQPVPMRVVEIGGWDGATAAMVLKENGPDRISSWINYEMATPARVRWATRDPRYFAPAFYGQPWDHAGLSMANVLYASHVLEHVSVEDIGKLLRACSGAMTFYAEVPVGEGPRDWSGLTCTHVLDVGWSELATLIASFGFHEFMRRNGEVEVLSGSVRGFVR